jgi:hypothetical protein
VVGLLERFEESLALMKPSFGWMLKNYSSFNVTRSRPTKRELPKLTVDLIAQRNHFDIELYQCAARLFLDAVTKKPVKSVVSSVSSKRREPGTP